LAKTPDINACTVFGQEFFVAPQRLRRRDLGNAATD
jgi:hypothetical protein